MVNNKYLIPGTLEWDHSIDEDLPRDHVTAETRKTTKDEAKRFRGGVRISGGRFYTDEEYEKYRLKVLKRPLP